MDAEDTSGPEVQKDGAWVADPISQTYRQTLAKLRFAQKPPYGVAAWSRFVNRPLGRYFAAAAYHARLTPNQVSIISAAFTFTGIALIAIVAPHPLVSLLAGLLLVLGYAIDSADGQVARLTGRGSHLGEWLDHMLDCAKIATVHLAVLIHLYRFGHNVNNWQLLLPLGYSIVGSVLFFGVILTDQLRRSATRSARGHGTKGASIMRSLLLTPVDFGILAITLSLLNWEALFLSVYAILFLATTGSLTFAVRGWVRALRTLDRSDTT